MNRWKVEGVYGEHQLSPFEGGGTKKGTRWVVRHDGDDEFTYDCIEFDTFAEAIVYADIMARTVRSTLPRITNRKAISSKFDAKYEPPLTVERFGRMTWINQYADGTGGFVIIDNDQLKPLALTLLAHHYKQEQA